MDGLIAELENIAEILFNNGYNSWGNAIHKAIKKIKGQEPKQVDLYGNDEWWGLVCVCPDCNAEWMTDKANAHFCPNCGRSVKLE